MTELGNDLSAFKTEHRFASWLSLCPDNETSAGKVLRRRTRRCDYPDSSDTDFGLIFSCCLFVSGMALGCPEHSATVRVPEEVADTFPQEKCFSIPGISFREQAVNC